MKTVSLLTLLLFSLVSPFLTAQVDHGFSLKESRSFHHRFEYPFGEWNQGGDFTRYVYLNFLEFWPHSTLASPGHIRDLPTNLNGELAEFLVADGELEDRLAEYIRLSATNGFIVCHRGEVVFEDYPRMNSTDRHIWFSISKTFIATAIAILHERGQLDYNQPVDHYLTELSNTAWEGIRIIDLLDMASGIDCPEVKDEGENCFWSFYDAFGFPRTNRAEDDIIPILQKMQIWKPAGVKFDYTSVNSEVLNLLIERTSGERFSQFVEREIWSNVGAESDAFILKAASGHDFSAGGVSSRLRDLARFGILFTPSGRNIESPVISDLYLNAIQNGGRSELTEETKWLNTSTGDDSFRFNSFHWDVVTDDGDFYKGGFGGQGLYISPDRDLVVAWFGSPNEEGKQNRNVKVARQIATSGFFD